MSTHKKKVLIFIKAPSHNLKPIETFLSKRNFDVHSEIDIKTGLNRIFELDADFIFLAWDHTNPKIINLPKLIAQASMATVVPYIMSNTKEAFRKLNICQINPKLYSPISGPAIERLVIKYGLNNIKNEILFQKQLKNYNTEEDRSNMKADLLSHIENDSIDNISEALALNNIREEQLKQLYFRQESIGKRNLILNQSKKIALPNKAINELKNTIQNKIKKPLESLFNTLQESEIPKLSNIINQQNPRSLSKIADSIQSDEQISIGSDKALQKKPEILKAHCMSIYSADWCGYLIIFTNAELEFSSIDIIFTEWIKSQFNNLQEIDEYDLCELQNIDSDFAGQLNKKADYFEALKINNNDLSISFFSLEPGKMALKLNEDKNLIEIPTEDIPSDAILNFSLHLHLPENKKYIVYTQAKKKLSTEQKNRLLANEIILLYTPISFEKDYKKFVAEKNLKALCENLSKKNS